MMVFILHMMVPIEWVPYPQKECGYCGMTPKKDIYIYIYIYIRIGQTWFEFRFDICIKKHLFCIYFY